MKQKPSRGPSTRERQMLILMLRHQNENGEAPYPEELVEEFGFNLKYVLTIIGRLENKKLAKRTNGRVFATANAETYFQGNERPIRANSVIPTPIRVKGYVRAGRTSFSDMDVSVGEDIESPISIPNTKLERNTYALKVVGNSMEHENIFEDDYVIVEELQGLEQPRVGEMIVSEYVPLDLEKDNQEDESSTDDFMSLTLKVVKSKETKSNGLVYYLGWQKDNNANPNVIPVRKLRNVRRVIGVYRDVRKNK